MALSTSANSTCCKLVRQVRCQAHCIQPLYPSLWRALHQLADTMSWTTPATTGTAPLARANHGSALYKSKLFIFGGWDGNKRLNDVYALDTGTPSGCTHCLTLQSLMLTHTRAPCPLSSILCLLRCRRDALGGCQCLGCTSVSPCRNDPLLCARQVLPLWRLWPWCTLLQ